MDLNALLGATVDLSTYAPEILGTIYKRAKILSLLDYEDASRYNNIKTLHAMVLPNLPVGTTADYTKLNYFKLKLNNGKIVSLAVNWVNIESIAVVTQYRRVRLIIDHVSIEDEDRLRRLLVGNDYKIIELVEDK